MILTDVSNSPQSRVQDIIKAANAGKTVGGIGADQKVEITKNNANVRDNLGQEEFLSLLVTELKNQDPLEPMKDKEFIAQVAQFSSLEQAKQTNNNLIKLLGTLAQTNVVGMLGKNVTGVSPEDGTITGRATHVRYVDGEPYITIEGEDGAKEVKLDQITEVEWSQPDTGTSGQ